MLLQSWQVSNNNIHYKAYFSLSFSALRNNFKVIFGHLTNFMAFLHHLAIFARLYLVAMLSNGPNLDRFQPLFY